MRVCELFSTHFLSFWSFRFLIILIVNTQISNIPSKNRNFVTVWKIHFTNFILKMSIYTPQMDIFVRLQFDPDIRLQGRPSLAWVTVSHSSEPPLNEFLFINAWLGPLPPTFFNERSCVKVVSSNSSSCSSSGRTDLQGRWFFNLYFTCFNRSEF